ncbi:hypothetical protein ACS0TY_033914 [Phlomoides rotata]
MQERKGYVRFKSPPPWSRPAAITAEAIVPYALLEAASPCCLAQSHAALLLLPLCCRSLPAAHCRRHAAATPSSLPLPIFVHRRFLLLLLQSSFFSFQARERRSSILLESSKFPELSISFSSILPEALKLSSLTLPFVNDKVLIVVFRRNGRVVGDIPCVRFKVVKVSVVSLLTLFKEKKENLRS